MKGRNKARRKQRMNDRRKEKLWDEQNKATKVERIINK